MITNNPVVSWALAGKVEFTMPGSPPSEVWLNDLEGLKVNTWQEPLLVRFTVALSLGAHMAISVFTRREQPSIEIHVISPVDSPVDLHIRSLDIIPVRDNDVDE